MSFLEMFYENLVKVGFRVKCIKTVRSIEERVSKKPFIRGKIYKVVEVMGQSFLALKSEDGTKFFLLSPRSQATYDLWTYFFPAQKAGKSRTNWANREADLPIFLS